MSEVLAYLGLGGNAGDVESSFAKALCSIEHNPHCKTVRCSRLYRTEPWGLKEQPDFLNLCVEILWTGSLQELNDFTSQLEHENGRDRANETPWGPRPLDIDFLVFGATCEITYNLEVPHPRMHGRRFVLQPLADLAPELVPPHWDISIGEALRTCNDNGKVEPLTKVPWDSWRHTSE